MTDDEFCSVCGDPEFDEDGNETHLDEEEYDHDFDPEEVTTLEDVKEFADTVKSLAEAGAAVKKVLQSSKIEPSELKADRFKIPLLKFKMPDFKLVPHPDAKDEKRHKENIKLQKIAILTGAVVAIILGIVAIIFN